MAVGQLDGVDLRDVALDGQINEDVLQRIIDASPTDTPFLSAIGASSIGNDLFEWTMERLAVPVIDGQRVDGSGDRADQSKLGIRVRSYSEIHTKTIETSVRANALDTIGFARALVRQLNRRGLELKRDINATFLSNNASVAPTATVAPQTAGLAAWVVGQTLDAIPADSSATATYTDNNNVWDADAGAVDNTDAGWVAETAGIIPERTLSVTSGALSETAIRTVANSIWTLGHSPTKLHARPEVISLLSIYMFTSSARIATLIADGGGAASTRAASGAVNQFLTDFGVTLAFTPDRQMLQNTDGVNTNDIVFIYDPMAAEVATLIGTNAKVLDTNGLYDRRELQCDEGLKVLDWHGVGAIINVDPAAAVIA